MALVDDGEPSPELRSNIVPAVISNTVPELIFIVVPDLIPNIPDTVSIETFPDALSVNVPPVVVAKLPLFAATLFFTLFILVSSPSVVTLKSLPIRSLIAWPILHE